MTWIEQLTTLARVQWLNAASGKARKAVATRRQGMSDVHYKLMRLLQANPEMSQREVARELGVSLGKVNYCLRALIHKGWVKAVHFTNNRNKIGYMYLLTPRGLERKATLTVQFLQAKMREYELLRSEIRRMRREVDRLASGAGEAHRPRGGGER